MEQAPSLVVIAIAALVLPVAAARLRLPGVVLEILFGILVGPRVLGLVAASEFLEVLAALGFFLLMFLSGFEIDLGAFERQGPGRIVAAAAVFLLTLLTAYLASRALGYGLFMTFVLATTSVGIVVPTLRSTRRTATALGQAVLIAAILADFMTLVGVTVFAVFAERGLGLELLYVPVFFVLVAIVLAALRRAAWWYPESFERLFAADDPEEMGIRASLALMLAFVGLSALLGIEPVLGAFLAGTVFALVFRHRGHLERKLAGFGYGFLIPIFFINVGLQFELEAVVAPGGLVLVGSLLAAALLVKLLPSLILLSQGLSPRETLAAGVLLSARLSLIIAVAELGVELHLIDRSTEAGVIILAILTTTAAPTVFRLLLPPVPTTQGAAASMAPRGR